MGCAPLVLEYELCVCVVGCRVLGTEGLPQRQILCPFQPFRGCGRGPTEEPVVCPLPGNGGASRQGEAAVWGGPGAWVGMKKQGGWGPL